MPRLAFLNLLFAGLAVAGQAPSALGIFDAQVDVGKVLHPGSATYEPAAKSYILSGSGDNMWFGKDQFHFVYQKISADELTFSAQVTPLKSETGAEGNPHRKGVLIIRQSLDEDSAYVDVARHAEGLTSLQFREKKGAVTHEIESAVSGPAAVRLEKRGERFYLWVARQADDEFDFSGGSAWVEIRSPFYIGIGVCSHDKDSLERFAFTGMDLNTKPKRPKNGNYSTIETVLLSGDARTTLVSHKHLTSPGWSADGQAITYDSGNNEEQTAFNPLRTAAAVKPKVPITSSDFSYFTSKSGETIQVWRKSADGHESDQFTPDDSNNVSPHLSPDGKYLLILSYSREYSHLSDDIPVALRLMTLQDRSIKTLANFVGGPDALGDQPWSPDGQRIVFASYQSMSNLKLKF